MFRELPVAAQLHGMRPRAIVAPIAAVSIPKLKLDWRPAALTGDEVAKGLLVGSGFHESPPSPPCVGDADAPPAPPDSVAVAVAGDGPIPEGEEMAETKEPETVFPPPEPAPAQPQTDGGLVLSVVRVIETRKAPVQRCREPQQRGG